MEVILKEKVAKLGFLGDIVDVKPGYARNFLIPKGKGVRANKKNIIIFEKQKKELQKMSEDILLKAKENFIKIEDQTFIVKAVAGDGGKLFGSVGAKEITQAIAKQKKVLIEKRHVHMPNGLIRNTGEFSMFVRLHVDIHAKIKVIVEAE